MGGVGRGVGGCAGGADGVALSGGHGLGGYDVYVVAWTAHVIMAHDERMHEFGLDFNVGSRLDRVINIEIPLISPGFLVVVVLEALVAVAWFCEVCLYGLG